MELLFKNANAIVTLLKKNFKYRRVNVSVNQMYSPKSKDGIQSLRIEFERAPKSGDQTFSENEMSLIKAGVETSSIGTEVVSITQETFIDKKKHSHEKLVIMIKPIEMPINN